MHCHSQLPAKKYRLFVRFQFNENCNRSQIKRTLFRLLSILRDGMSGPKKPNLDRKFAKIIAQKSNIF